MITHKLLTLVRCVADLFNLQRDFSACNTLAIKLDRRSFILLQLEINLNRNMLTVRGASFLQGPSNLLFFPPVPFQFARLVFLKDRQKLIVRWEESFLRHVEQKTRFAVACDLHFSTGSAAGMVPIYYAYPLIFAVDAFTACLSCVSGVLTMTACGAYLSIFLVPS